VSDLKAGVIGTGFVGPAHVEALRRLGIDVVAVAGPRLDRVADKARSMRIDRYYDSAEALIADPEVNVVHITSPNHVHHAQAKAALLAGKHVVCEKPLAMDSRESAELVQLAAERHLINAVNFNIRFYPSCSRRARKYDRVIWAKSTSSTAATGRTGCSSPPIGTGGSILCKAARCAPWPTSARIGSISRCL